MVIPSEVYPKLVAETAQRLRSDTLFTAFWEVDTVAQSELRGCLGRLANKKREPMLRKKLW